MSPTLYDVLELKPDCSSKEIRSAFIKLSKVHHPDAGSGTRASSHSQFVKINEAYSVLSKPEARREYDISLQVMEVPGGYSPGSGQQVWRDEYIYRPGQGFGKAEHKPYYGIKGVKKVSNGAIVLACFIFAGLGIVVQGFAINKSFTFSRDKLDQQSLESYKMLQRVRERASTSSREEQLERIKKGKFES